MNNKRIGILGGSFDPVHLGHIELATKAKEVLQLDKVIFMLAARPPHKLQRKLHCQQERFNILKLALSAYPDFLPSDLELKMEGPSFTYRTISALKKDYPQEQFFFLIGAESFLQIRSWKNYHSLLAELIFFVALRRKSQLVKVQRLVEQLNIDILSDLKCIRCSSGVVIFDYQGRFSDISSSLIRKKLKNGQDCPELLPAEAYEKIKEVYKH